MKRGRRIHLALAAVALASLASVPNPGSSALPGCAPTTTQDGAPWPGGEWRQYGHDLSNSRSQPAETTIGPDNVRSLAPAWVFSAGDAVDPGEEGGAFSNTPVVADGCVYLTSNTGWVFALNADTGALLWRRHLEGGSLPLVGAGIVGSPTIQDGIMYLGVSLPSAPYVVALDQATGVVLWKTVVETGQPDAFLDAAPIVFDGMIFQGFAGFEGNTEVSRGGYAILEAGASGGDILAHHYTVSDEEFAGGYRGASVWCTGTLDPATRHVYACGGNPHSEGLEAKNANSLLKIDFDRSRPTFGKVVASYKGNVDQYYPGLDDQPVCENFGEETTVLVWSVGCIMLDLDFGASPNLFRDPDGRLLVGDLQKSGVYHAVYADDMTPAWQAIVAPPCFSCNAASGAVDGTRVYTTGSPPGQLFGLSIADAPLRHQWVAPIPGGTHYQSTSVANGVVYTMDNFGFLNAVDAATGIQLMKRPLSLDTGGSAADPSSQGVSIARNTVYAASSEFVVAYKVGGGGGGGGPGLPSLPSLGAGTAVVAGPGSASATYLTPAMIVNAANPKLTFLNLDLAQHDVDHRGDPQLFSSPLIGAGQTTPVTFAGPLEPGTYQFYCSIHPNMTGQLIAI